MWKHDSLASGRKVTGFEKALTEETVAFKNNSGKEWEVSSSCYEKKRRTIMELKKVLNPWNWFKKEEEQAQNSRSMAVAPVGSNLVDRLHQDIDQVFDSFFRGFPLSPFYRGREGAFGSVMFPQVNIAEGKKDYTITVEVPGVEEKDIEVTLANDTLTVRGEKQCQQEDQEKQYHRIERFYGSFQRVISLPADADENDVKAKFKNGVLTITIGKNPQAKPAVRKIAIS
jgi:HSP20 family protein